MSTRTTANGCTGDGRVRITMLLPPAEVDGHIEEGYGTPMWLHRDQRVPAPLRDTEPHLVASYRNPDCPRHLFDVVESARDVETEPETEDGEWKYEQEFRARLTCVRCGLILAWEGRRDGEVKDPRPVQVEPLCVGDLVAQMIDAGSSGWYPRNDDPHAMSTWAVHRRGGERVGVITWGRGPRGRDFFVGRLFAWPDGEKVEAPTVVAVLRKMSRRGAAVPEGVAR